MVLSLILCSRNDEYMGNSRWRLETALNYVASRIAALGRQADVEIVVTDWGSDVPLRNVVQLSPDAANLVSFLTVPRSLASNLQRDSPFAEVLALNAAARRARGEYVGRIDQDTLVGRQFLQTFFACADGTRRATPPLDAAVFFANQRMVPYRFAAQCPVFDVVDEFVARFGRRCPVELTARRPFYEHGVGMLLMRRQIWHECGGFDERMIYMNDMEINLISRLRQRYPVANLADLVGYDFYHLEHYHPRHPRTSSSHRPVNDRSFHHPDAFNPNAPDWGLATHVLERRGAPAAGNVDAPPRAFGRSLRLWSVACRAGAGMLADRIVVQWATARRTWLRRARLALDAVMGQRVSAWPRILVGLWLGREGRTRS